MLQSDSREVYDKVYETVIDNKHWPSFFTIKMKQDLVDYLLELYETNQEFDKCGRLTLLREDLK